MANTFQLQITGKCLLAYFPNKSAIISSINAVYEFMNQYLIFAHELDKKQHIGMDIGMGTRKHIILQNYAMRRKN